MSTALGEPLLRFVSIGCNRSPHCAAWGNNGLVAFGAFNYVALYDPEEERTIGTLCGHAGRVNAISWIPVDPAASARDAELAAEDEIASASSDCTIAIWRSAGGADRSEWLRAAVLAGHGDAVTCLAVLRRVHAGTLIASCSADGSVRVWTRPQSAGDWKAAARFDYAPRMMHAVAAAVLPGCGAALVAAGGVDGRVHLYAEDAATGSFARTGSLAGHQDWVRALEFRPAGDEEDLLLASSAQDATIRLWRVSALGEGRGAGAEGPAGGGSVLSPELLEALNLSLGGGPGAAPRGHAFAARGPAGRARFTAALEALLSGHEDWVYGLAWHPPVPRPGGAPERPLCLLSASMDRTMALWRPDPGTGVWLTTARVGDLSGGTLGFMGGVWGPRGDALLAHGFNGAFHLWRRREAGWAAEVAVSGHFGPISDCSWDPSSRYLLSASADQTARLFAPWTREAPGGERRSTWCEVARPQIHGYDLAAIAFQASAPGLPACHRYAAAADEKVVRVLEAPQTFFDSFARIAGAPLSLAADEARPLAANVPPLGLSNRPIFPGQAVGRGEGEVGLGVGHRGAPLGELEAGEGAGEGPTDGSGGGDEEGGPPGPSGVLAGERAPVGSGPFRPVPLSRPPLEEQLLQNTLWPEVQKLFGHLNEVVALASSCDGALIASACKSTKAEHAEIRLWDTATWKERFVAHGHALTVTQLEFAPGPEPGTELLLSASRDRSVAVWTVPRALRDARPPPGGEPLSPDCMVEAHERIVWACSWAPSGPAGPLAFATGSRDQTVKIWGRVAVGDSRAWGVKATLPVFEGAVTALAWAPGSHFLLAVGLEAGAIELWRPEQTDPAGVWTRHRSFNSRIAHCAAVRRLRWRKRPEEDERDPRLPNDPLVDVELASCSSDHSLRVYSFLA
eukprot:tig00000980_g6137.t1